MSLEQDNITRLIENKGMQFRDFRIASVECRANDDGEKMVISGVPVVYNQETVLWKSQWSEHREIIDAGAMNGADMTDVIFNFNHGGRVYARTRNNSLVLTNQADGLHMTATLMMDDEGHKQLYRDIKTGLLDKMSFAFTVKKSEVRKIEQENDIDIYIRTIMEFDKLYDVTVVDIPAYDATSISARHAFEVENRELQAESRCRENRNKKKRMLLLMEVTK